MSIKPLAIVLIACFGIFLSAANAEVPREPGTTAENEVQHQMSPYEFTSRFTVRVENNVANVFTAAHSGGHGTGFFVEVREDDSGEEIGVIFTNNHVINREHGQVREISVEFSTDTDIPERVSAKVVYQSEIHDFAVLEFRMNDLERVRHRISPAMLPAPESPLYQFSKYHRELSGRESLAQGNPFDSKAITTFGRINGIYHSEHAGDFIQTQTPINPGNSGGPLIDVETLQVIGINTMKLASEDADSVGYAIPIGEVLSEYREWREHPLVARPRELDVRFGTNPVGELEIIGAKAPIAAKYPDFFKRFAKVLRVHDAAAATGLKSGDQIVSIGGELMPPSVHELKRRLQRAGPSIAFEVVRNQELLTIDVPIRDAHFARKRIDLDFVYLSGLIFRSIPAARRWQIDANLKSTVIVDGRLDTPETIFGAMRMPDNKSVLVAVNVDGSDYPIHTLTDLKAVLRAHSGAKFIRLDVREPIMTPVVVAPEVGVTPAIDFVFGGLVYRSTIATYVVPLMEVITPFQFSMHKFEEQFSFRQSAPETRDWRRYVNSERKPGQDCSQILKKKPILEMTYKFSQ